MENTSTSLGKVKFNILNMAKSDSLYNYGMKVLCFSEKEQANNNRQWFRGGSDISYFQNNFRKETRNGKMGYHYTFTFSYKFTHSSDKVFFAYSMPYTYTDLCDDLTVIEKD